MPGDADSQYQREKLSRLLRDLRSRAELGGREAARRAGFSQSKLSKIETGQLLPSFEDVKALCRALGAASREREAALDVLKTLLDEVESARVILSRGAYRKQQEIQRIEEESRLMRSFDMGAVIGLLQTADYMRTIFSRRLSVADREAAVSARQRRTEVLDDLDREFVFVMSEGALRWRAGSAATMVEQIGHVAELALRPNVRVGVIAWTTQVHVFPGHEFHIYDDRMVIVGIETATATIRDPRDVAVYVELFAELEGLADFGDAAQKTLERIASDYRSLPG